MNAATIKKPQPHPPHVIASITEDSLAKPSALPTETGNSASLAVADAMICILDDDGREFAVTSDMIHTKLSQLRAAC